MTQQIDTAHILETLETFLELFDEYAQAIFDSGKAQYVTGPRRNQRPPSPQELRTQLQRMEPQVTNIVLEVTGDSQYTLRHCGTISKRNLLANALMGGNNAMPHNLRLFNPVVTSVVQQAIGTLESGPWPPKTPTPVLVIHDDDLRRRCTDLLSASANYDRVVLEATTVLEDRIRRRPSIEVLAKVIPNTADQTGDNLVNKLLSPDKPVLSVSSDRTRRIALHRMLLGVVSYLRNPYHHQLDDQTHQSWAWSAVGLIDRLLADIDSCTVEKT